MQPNTDSHVDKRGVCGRQNQNSHRLDSTATYINIQTNTHTHTIYYLLLIGEEYSKTQWRFYVNNRKHFCALTITTTTNTMVCVSHTIPTRPVWPRSMVRLVIPTMRDLIHMRIVSAHIWWDCNS
jgi:hypothetical protein